MLPVMVTNGMLAVELALKALIYMETGDYKKTHKTDDLFYALPNNHKTELMKKLKEEAFQDEETLRFNLEQNKDNFELWRYFYESECVGFSSFTSAFIHIVCRYAIDIAKQ